MDCKPQISGRHEAPNEVGTNCQLGDHPPGRWGGMGWECLAAWMYVHVTRSTHRAEPRSWEVPQNGQAEPGRDTELRKPIFRNMMQNELCPD